MARATTAVEGWEDGSDDEDTLTGDLGATLRTRPSIVTSNGETWMWRVRYKKFRGRGPGALERPTGADGIFQIEVTRGDEKHFKGLLFQAKKAGTTDGRLAAQVERMEGLASGGSAIFEYGPNAYRAATGHAYLTAGSPSLRSKGAPLQSLSSFLGDSFLPCGTGLRGMYYDALRALLLLPTGPAIRIPIRHRIVVEAELRNDQAVAVRSNNRSQRPSPRVARQRRST